MEGHPTPSRGRLRGDLLGPLGHTQQLDPGGFLHVWVPRRWGCLPLRWARGHPVWSSGCLSPMPRPPTHPPLSSPATSHPQLLPLPPALATGAACCPPTTKCLHSSEALLGQFPEPGHSSPRVSVAPSCLLLILPKRCLLRLAFSDHPTPSSLPSSPPPQEPAKGQGLGHTSCSVNACGINVAT